MVEEKRIAGLINELINQITKTLGLNFVSEQETEGNVCFANNPDLRVDYRTSFATLDLLDYMYAVLQSPTYRGKYKASLKIDFPRIPYPRDAETFWTLVKLGGELRQIHLSERASVDSFITSLPEAGTNIVTRKMTKTSIGFEPECHTERWSLSEIEVNRSDNKNESTLLKKTEVIKGKEKNKHIAKSRVLRNDARNVTSSDSNFSSESYREVVIGKVWINDTQYFDNVPKIAWDFYIGGYQPAQKWLIERINQTITFEHILHYQKLIVALTETDRLMKAIDKEVQ